MTQEKGRKLEKWPNECALEREKGEVGLKKTTRAKYLKTERGGGGRCVDLNSNSSPQSEKMKDGKMNIGMSANTAECDKEMAKILQRGRDT